MKTNYHFSHVNRKETQITIISEIPITMDFNKSLRRYMS